MSILSELVCRDIGFLGGLLGIMLVRGEVGGVVFIVFFVFRFIKCMWI